ncbi:MAG: hypothetical protein EPO68_14705 [Planctomycetota bacterium]|nr:MAG: hypothetical protein EPO68_14705 [Planctomycetota bacterium]
MADASHDRRQFLAFLGSTAALSASACRSASGAPRAAAAHGSIEEVLPQITVPIPSTIDTPATQAARRAEQLNTAWQRARSLGKPLLVVLFPRDSGRHEDAGRVFGGLLNHATRDELACLALAELACATVADAERVCGVWIGGSPPCALIDAPELGGALSITPLLVHASGASDSGAEQRARALFDAIRDALAPDQAALDKLIARSLACLPESKRAWFEGLGADCDAPAPADALAHAALVHRAAARSPAAADKLWTALAAGAQSQWIAQPPPGAHWAVSTGCGGYVEGESTSTANFACGMAMVPHYSRRFLCWYERSDAIDGG